MSGSSSGTSARPSLKDRGLVDRVLSHPELFPDEFKAWLPRFLAVNPNLKLSVTALPQAEGKHYVSGAGNAIFLNGWVNYDAGYEEAHYYVDLFGVVHLGGMVKSGIVGSAAFNLPTRYRPSAREMFAVVSNGALGRVDVLETGDVIPFTGSNAYFSLSGITFRAF